MKLNFDENLRQAIESIADWDERRRRLADVTRGSWPFRGSLVSRAFRASSQKPETRIHLGETHRSARRARTLAPSKFIWKFGKFAQYRRSLPPQSLRGPCLCRSIRNTRRHGRCRRPRRSAITRLPFTRASRQLNFPSITLLRNRHAFVDYIKQRTPEVRAALAWIIDE